MKTKQFENTIKNNIDVRESMAIFPHILQPLLTWLTGKPLQNQKPFINQTPFLQLATALLSIFAGCALSILLLTLSPIWWPLFAASWMLTVGGARKIQVMICHQCVHHTFTGNKTKDLWLCEVLSTLLFINHYKAYRYEHVVVHHGKKFATDEDPDCKFLLDLGFLPGMGLSQLWRHLFKTIFSLRFHATFLAARLKANFIDCPNYRKCMSVIYVTTMIFFTVSYQLSLPLLVAWILPLTLLYHVAALLNFSSLHIWLKQRDEGQSNREAISELSIGRFLGDPVPQKQNSIVRSTLLWMRWSLRLVFLHLPSRIFVLVGDLPVHDYHHRYPRCKDWPNALYTRQRDIEAGCPGWPLPYYEIWGLPTAINTVFKHLNQLPKPNNNKTNIENSMNRILDM